jgi:hypothetical protein
MKSGMRSAAKVIAVTCADAREAAASFEHFLIGALPFPFVLPRFHNTSGAVGVLALFATDLPALVACVAFTIAAYLLRDRRFVARLHARLW